MLLILLKDLMRQAKTDLAEQIFSATDRLMAREGLNQLSMLKIGRAHV